MTPPWQVIPAECPTCLTRWQDSEVIEGDKCPRCVEEEGVESEDA